MGNHEWCFYGWKEGAAHHFFGPPNVPDVWSVKKVNPASMVHLTEKPVELSRLAIEYSSLPGENVLDLFAGSGSTLIAAEQTGRRGFAMELDPLYCDVIVARFETFTGTKAERIPAPAPRRRLMGRRGPAPTPTGVKLRQGETRPSRINRLEPLPRRAAPQMPRGMDRDAQKVWRRVVREMRGSDVILAADADVLRCYVEAVSRYAQAAELYAKSARSCAATASS